MQSSIPKDSSLVILIFQRRHPTSIIKPGLVLFRYCQVIFKNIIQVIKLFT